MQYKTRVRGALQMTINYDVQKITAALGDFRNATGIEAQLLKPDFTPACDHRLPGISYCKALQETQSGHAACLASDAELLKKSRASGKTEMAICHAGLLNVVIPLLINEEIIGYIIFGGMKPDANFRLPEGEICPLPITDGDMGKYYGDIPEYSLGKIQSISNVAIMLAKYILLKNMLKPTVPESIKKAVDYINANLASDLSITKLSKNANISKSALYKKFHDHFGCTVSEYIKTRRVEAAKELMSDSELSMEEIAQHVGFSGASYFSRVFKEHTGISPMRYKKEIV